MNVFSKIATLLSNLLHHIPTKVDTLFMTFGTAVDKTMSTIHFVTCCGAFD